MIERVGKSTGRWQRYKLYRDGEYIATVRRTLVSGGDRMVPHARHDAWDTYSGMIFETREGAEADAIERFDRLARLRATGWTGGVIPKEVE